MDRIQREESVTRTEPRIATRPVGRRAGPVGFVAPGRPATTAAVLDSRTVAHGGRIARASTALARSLGLDERSAGLIGQAARYHDIGKIAIARSILHKPGRLTAREFDIVKTHTLHGATLLARSRLPQRRLAAQIALYHHENWDGSGYPFGLERDRIPLPARIVAVVDVFDALRQERCYKGAWPEADALAFVARERGGKFDPRVVDAFLRLRYPFLPRLGDAEGGRDRQDPAPTRFTISSRLERVVTGTHVSL